jgi:hypothetical protein
MKARNALDWSFESLAVDFGILFETVLIQGLLLVNTGRVIDIAPVAPFI